MKKKKNNDKNNSLELLGGFKLDIKNKKQRIKTYLKSSLIWATGFLFLNMFLPVDYFDSSFGISNRYLSFLVEFVVDFLVFFLIDYLTGEFLVKKQIKK